MNKEEYLDKSFKLMEKAANKVIEFLDSIMERDKRFAEFHPIDIEKIIPGKKEDTHKY